MDFTLLGIYYLWVNDFNFIRNYYFI